MNKKQCQDCLPRNHKKSWRPGDDARLMSKVVNGDTTYRIARDLGRTQSAVRSRASELNVSLKPKD